MSNAHPLDNIIWQALTTRQANVARVNGTARRFEDDIGPLSGMPEFGEEGLKDLSSLAKGDNRVALFMAAPWQQRAGWTVLAEAPLMRMVCEKPVLLASTSQIIPLGDADSAGMIDLTTLARPGPFGPRTHKLGDFFGIRENGKLVAMAGERMKVPGYTEVSAVCTHPAYLGKGYAGAVMSKVISGITQRGETPFLHVRADNERATGLYERLGFKKQWLGHFAALQAE